MRNQAHRRPPRGGRGLKLLSFCVVPVFATGRPPRGGRGLKCYRLYDGSGYQYGRPPRGGRGLKSKIVGTPTQKHKVAPLAGGVD